ncbi:glycerophosphoryl diester phosphodiesterase [Nanchangia anserum]|uniref:Glycerophosphoryl diester phosphodiesterase n=1 Tax=Nanchangia anserum TaxID=2692125 RepID=A0A8I0KU52_9ACTO|nr:glycerophosphodiester phosphodiesterase family protein [Nanchangia anserum]MBD3689318.1 glycerophosphoryl diester phosphodiesterase [Nanchangia anserum]QOX81532.1 glycerophosphoryl diester phosphodiesterase [Nanchangia anserum]
MKPPRVIGHRGACAHAPENTLAAFRLAAEMCGWAELDVDLLADGTVVVCHDRTLERTTTGSGRVEEATWDDVAGLDAGGWFDPRFAGEPLARLSDVIDLANEVGLSINVELKSPLGGAEIARRLVAATAAQLRRLDPGCDVIVSSFNHLMLPLMAAEGEWPLACLFEAGQLGEDWRTRAELAGARILHPCLPDVTAGLVTEMRAAGYRVNVWTVNDPEDARALARMGVDGIITNDPEAIRAAIAQV